MAGTLDTGAGALNLGGGDDNFFVHDATNVVGTVVGGAGQDTRAYDIAGIANVGALSEFEGLTKRGAGTMNLTGPGVSDLADVRIEQGTLDMQAGASVVAQATGSFNTLVASGTTLNVDGSYVASTNADTFDVSGTVGGAGTIALAGGDDTLTLNDGAVLNNVIDGGAHGAGDTVVLNNTNALSFNAGNTVNFEILQKNNAGTATLTGTQTFASGAAINGGTLDVDGTLNTSTVTMSDGTTLNVDGRVQASGATQTVLANTAGAASTVTIGSGGTLLASGDLGDGNDMLDVAGTLDSGAGTLALGDGDDTLTVHDGTNILGSVAAGAGTDTFNTDIALAADVGAVQGFETLSKTGVGTLNVNGPTSSDFTTVNVLAGRLNVNAAGSLTGVSNATVASGATLNVDGSFGFTAGADSFTVAGSVTGLATVDMLDGDDSFTVQDGADLSGLVTAVNGGLGTDTLTADIAGASTLGGAVNFETLIKSNTGTLNINGPASSEFDTVLVQGGTLRVAAGVIVDPQTTVVSSGATMTVDGTYQGTAGADTFTVSGTVNGTGTIDLLGDDDVLTLNDGADLSALANPLDGGAHGAGDTVVLNNTGALAFNGSNITNFESLQKTNTGTATLTGTSTFSGGTALSAGTLDVDGTLNTSSVALGDATTLNVDGTLQNSGPTQTLITGSAGANTVSVSGVALATGNLGSGADVLDVFGTLDTGSGTLALGDGDDRFIVHDGAVALGTIDGGAGLDSRVYDISLNATLGALVGFEGVTKTGTGTLTINGPSATNLQQVNVLRGTLSIGPGGSVVASAGSLATVVASGATLNVNGAYGCGAGNDTMTVSGTVSGSGTIGLCGGDDTLTLNDGSVLNSPIDGGAHGSGDTVVLNNNLALTLDAGRTINFETLQKTGFGVLTLAGNQAYNTTLIDAGTATIAAGGTLTSQATTIAAGATLNVQGNFSGTAGDDSFTSRGNVIGAQSFAAGNDTVAFIGGDISGLTGVDGGAGGSDRLSFSGLSFDAGDFAMTGWERVELSNDSALTLGAPFALSGGVLAIDATSRLNANTGASISGSVENAGLISLGANRLAISGGYQANNGALQLRVSPGGAGSGGLDIAGDVTGNTRVTFTSDGTDVPQQQAASIQVISSASDNLSTAGGFTATDTVGGHVRLTGSISPWDFSQHADKSWYLDAVAGILPETAGYAVLPSIGHANIQNTNHLLFQRMDSVRSDDAQHCGASDSKQAGQVTGQCQGAWAAVTGSDLEMGADPGFEFSGDSVGTFAGVGGSLSETQDISGGFFAGFQRGNYQTTGVNSTDLPGAGKSSVEVYGPAFGVYGSFDGRGGTYIDVSLVAQLPTATITVADGFHQRIAGQSLTLSTQLGHRFAPGTGWIVEPQVQLSGSTMEWGDGQVDASGKQLVLDDDMLGTARASLHVEKMFETTGGARIRPWATIGVQDTLGEKQDAFSVVLPGSSAGSQAFPSHELGLTATLDAGVEADLSKSASLFGVVSYGESLRGSESEQLQANVGVRFRW